MLGRPPRGPEAKAGTTPLDVTFVDPVPGERKKSGVGFFAERAVSGQGGKVIVSQRG